MAAFELLQTVLLGEAMTLCITLQKQPRLRSMCEVRAVAEDMTEDVPAKTYSSPIWD